MSFGLEPIRTECLGNGQRDLSLLERLSVSQLHHDLARFDFDVVRTGCLGRRHRQRIAGAKIKFRSMARTANAIPVHLSFTQRPTIVGAYVVDAIHISVYQSDKHEPIVDFERGWDVWF